jgi:hypothetical protein
VLGDTGAVGHQQQHQAGEAEQRRGAPSREESQQRGEAHRARRAQERGEAHPVVVAVVGPLDGLDSRQPPVQPVEQVTPVAGAEQPERETHGPEAEGQAGQPDQDRGGGEQAVRGALAAAQRGGETAAHARHAQRRQRRGRAGPHEHHQHGPPEGRRGDQRDPVRRGEQGERREGGQPHQHDPHGGR